MRREVRPYGAFSLLPDLNIVPESDQKTHERSTEYPRKWPAGIAKILG
jgi:hypothetical protein